MRTKTIFAACSALAITMAVATAAQAQTAQAAGESSAGQPPIDQPQVEPTQTQPSQASPNTADTHNAAPDELVVTARRREESLKDVPIAVSAVTDATLKQQQIYTVREVAAYVPGLNINSDSVGRAFISIRGIGTTLIDSVQPGVGIFIDGIYQPNTSYLNSPLVDIARVEVLRGPQGTLFGNNTLGGAINVITRQPSNDFVGKLDAAYAGPDDFKSISGSISGPIVKDVLQFRLGAAYHHHDGFQENILDAGDQNPVTQKTVNGSLRFLPTNWATFTLNANYDQVFGGSTGYLGVSGPKDYTLDGSTNQRTLAKITYRGVSGKGEFDLAQIDTKIIAIGAYNRRDLSQTGDGDFGPVDFARTAGYSNLVTWTGEVRADTNWNDRVSTLVGLYYDHFTYDAYNDTTLPLLGGIVSPATANSVNETEAVFGTVFFKLTPTIELAGGLRYDHQKLQADTSANGAPFSAPDYKTDELQPRVTLTKHWTPDVMTYASVARGVRGGGQNGAGAPNPIYKGDSVWTYEVGTKFTALDRRLSVDADVFYNDYNDFIGQNSLAPIPGSQGAFVAVNLNTGHVKSYGAEVEGHVRLTDAWRVDGSLTLLHSRITNDDEYFATTGVHVSTDRIIFTPDWNFNIGTTYTLPVGENNLVFNANLIGKGSRPGSSLDPDVSPTLASYYLVNGSVAYQIKNIEVAVFATNLFNEKYIESYIDRSALSRAGLDFLAQNLAIQGDRRRVGVRTSLRF